MYVISYDMKVLGVVDVVELRLVVAQVATRVAGVRSVTLGNTTSAGLAPCDTINTTSS